MSVSWLAATRPVPPAGPAATPYCRRCCRAAVLPAAARSSAHVPRLPRRYCRLALSRPRWDPPSNHHMFPQRFKDVARLLLLACCRPAGANGGGAAPSSSGSSRELQLDLDVLLEVLRHAAYPVSMWMS